MKILHIISGDLWAGAEVQAFTLLTTLHQQGEVLVAAALMNEGELAERLRQCNIPVTVFPEHTLSAIDIVTGLRKLMRDWKPDVIHTHRIKENILGTIANKLSVNVPSVRTVHGGAEHISKGFRQMHKHALNYLNTWTGRHLQQKIIAVSQDLARKLTGEFPSNQIVVIENGIDIDAIRTQVHPVEIRTTARHAAHIGIVGRLVPVKRIDLFLETAALLHSQNPDRDWHFHIFGDGPLRPALNQQCEQLMLADATTFHGHRKDIIACIAALDVLVMCSDHEGLPMTLLEAMTVNTPVVAHAVGGMPDALRGYPSSALVNEHSPNGYASAIEHIIKGQHGDTPTDPNFRFSARENASRMTSLYSYLMENQ